MGRRRVFLIDGADTMRADVSNVFLKVLEEPPGSATLILMAPTPFSLLPTIVSRCMQFHFAPLPLPEVEAILNSHGVRKGADLKLAAQLSEGSPGLAMEMNLDEAVEKRKIALRVLERAAPAAKDFRNFSLTPLPWRKTANSPSRNSLQSSTDSSPTF